MKRAVGLAVFGVAMGLILQSCGSSDDKKKVRSFQAGGEGGESSGGAGGGAGGQAGEPSPATSGAGGVESTAGAAGDASSSGAGGAAGSPSECPTGFDECDGDPNDACEQDLSEVDFCGDCDTACVNEHGGIVCEDLACKVTSCDAGYDDCNGDPNDGCETLLTENDEHCGACGRDCTSVGATCTVNSCGDIPMQQNIALGTGNGPANDRAFAFSPDVGIANMTRVNGVVRLFSLDGVTSKVIWDTGAGLSGNETLVIDGQDILWAKFGTPSVVQKKAAGAEASTPPTDLFFPEYCPAFLRQQGDYYYWITGESGEPGYIYRRLRTAPQSDPGTRIMDVAQGYTSTITGFAVTTDAIYWITADDSNAGTLDNDVRTVPLTGGTPTSIPKVAGAATAQIKDFGNFTLAPNLIAVGDTLYFARTVDETPINGVYRYKTGDLAPTKVLTAENVTTFAVGEEFVYFGLHAQQGVLRAPLAGGPNVMVGPSYQTTIVGVDEQFAYVAFVNQPSYLYKIFQ